MATVCLKLEKYIKWNGINVFLDARCQSPNVAVKRMAGTGCTLCREVASLHP